MAIVYTKDQEEVLDIMANEIFDDMQNQEPKRGSHCGETDDENTKICSLHNIKCKHVGTFTHCYIRENDSSIDSKARDEQNFDLYEHGFLDPKEI